MKPPEKEITVNGFKYTLAYGQEEVTTWKEVKEWYDQREECDITERGMSELCQLYVTAKYLNGDWVPSDEKDNYYPYLDGVAIHVHYVDYLFYSGRVFFKDKATAMKAVEILGEDVVRKALMFGAV